MTAFDVTAAIDAIVADLQASAGALGLPTFQVQKYVQPLLVSAEMNQPLLAVYVAAVHPRVLSTSGDYDAVNYVTVAWFESVVDSLNTGIVDNNAAKGIIQRGQAIQKHIQPSYFAGIPGYAYESEVTVHQVRFGKPMGGVYGVEIDLRIADFA